MCDRPNSAGGAWFLRTDHSAEANLFVPHPLAAPFAFEKADRLALAGIEELVGELKRGCARRAVVKPISRFRGLLRVHHHGPNSN